MIKYYSTFLSTAEIRNSDNTKLSFGKDVEKVDLSYIAGGNVKGIDTLEKFGSFFLGGEAESEGGRERES